MSDFENLNDNQIIERITNLEKTRSAKGLSKKQSQNLARLKRKASSDGLVIKLPGEKDTRYPMLTKKPDSKTDYSIKQVDPGEQLDRALWPEARVFNRPRKI